jgi:hypothetical protein
MDIGDWIDNPSYVLFKKIEYLILLRKKISENQQLNGITLMDKES